MSIMNAMTTWQNGTLITGESGTGQEHRNLRSILSLVRHKKCGYTEIGRDDESVYYEKRASQSSACTQRAL